MEGGGVDDGEAFAEAGGAEGGGRSGGVGVEGAGGEEAAAAVVRVVAVVMEGSHRRSVQRSGAVQWDIRQTSCTR